MNIYFLISAILGTLLSVIHSYMGEKYFLPAVFKREFMDEVGNERYINRTMRTAWHLTTIGWLSAVFVLVLLSFRELDETGILVVRAISSFYLLSGVVSLIGSRGRHLSWVAFFVIALLSWLGTT